MSFLQPVYAVYREIYIDIFKKYGYFPLELCRKLWSWKISPRQVVNKTHRRSSLWITPTAVDEVRIAGRTLFIPGRSAVTL